MSPEEYPPRYKEDGPWRNLITDEPEWLARPKLWGVDYVPLTIRVRKQELKDRYFLRYHFELARQDWSCAACASIISRYIDGGLEGFTENEFFSDPQDSSHPYRRVHSEVTPESPRCKDWETAKNVPFWFRGVTTWQECKNHVLEGILTRSRLRQNQLQSWAEVQAWERWLALELVGPNPFRPIAFDPAWQTEVVTTLARIADETAEFGNLSILADALEEAGCDVPEILTHLRGPSPHVRGCWVVDRILRVD